jgi:hypothetical protein
MMYVTLDPSLLNKAILAAVDTLIAVGEEATRAVETLCKALDIQPPTLDNLDLEKGEALLWRPGDSAKPIRMRVAESRTVRRRHSRKYAEGELPQDCLFYFRGPEGKLNLRAQNLIIFLQLADGVDEDTWMHHLRQGDYSRWFRECIKDEILSAETKRIEALPHIDAAESRAQIKALVEEHYTLPGGAPAAVEKSV